MDSATAALPQGAGRSASVRPSRRGLLSRLGGDAAVRLGMLCLIVPVGLALLSLVLPLGSATEMSAAQRLSPPSPELPFGADSLGRDLFARVAQGGVTSLAIGVSVAVLAAAGGLVLGLLAGYLRAVDDGVSFDVARGETLALVGESGCGKSTTGRCLLRLMEPTAGEIRLDGTNLLGLGASAMRVLRRRLQIVFQDPGASLTSHLTVGEQVAEPLHNLLGIRDGSERRARVGTLLRRVGLSPEDAHRYPHEFSGGQRQRVCIARALAAEPDLIVCDEAVSALDVSIKAQIVNLLIDLQEKDGVGYLFISHDMGVVAAISHRVAVMYLGRIVEMAPAPELFDAPRHPYTRALLEAVPMPRVGGRRRDLAASVAEPPPAGGTEGGGCRYRDRCPMADTRCAREDPPLSLRDPGHMVACHHA